MSIRHISPTLRIGQWTTIDREIQLVESDHASDPIDLTDAERVTLTLEHHEFGFTAIDDGECTIVEPTEGIVEYTFTQQETSLHGRYSLQFEVTWSDGETDLVPPDSEEWALDIGRRQPGRQPLHAPSITADDGVFGVLQSDSFATETASIGELTGPVDAGGHSIDNIGDAPSIRGAVPQEYVDQLFSENYVEGMSNPATANLDLNGYDALGPGRMGTPSNPLTAFHATEGQLGSTRVSEGEGGGLAVETDSTDPSEIVDLNVRQLFSGEIVFTRDYGTFQEAFDAVNPGGTVWMTENRFNEDVTITTQGVTLMGGGMSTYSTKTTGAFTVNARGVTLVGIRGSLDRPITINHRNFRMMNCYGYDITMVGAPADTALPGAQQAAVIGHDIGSVTFDADTNDGVISGCTRRLSVTDNGTNNDTREAEPTGGVQALLAGGQLLPSGEFHQVEWDSETNQTGGAATRDTVGEVTINQDGTYLVNFNGCVNDVGSGVQLSTRITVNGIQGSRGATHVENSPGGFRPQFPKVMKTIPLEAGETVAVSVRQESGADQYLDDSDARTWFDVRRLD